MTARKGLVLDPNILLRAVFGQGVRGRPVTPLHNRQFCLVACSGMLHGFFGEAKPDTSLTAIGDVCGRVRRGR